MSKIFSVTERSPGFVAAKRWRVGWPSFVALAGLLGVVQVPGRADVVSVEVVKSAVAGNWKRLADALPPGGTTVAASPVARALKAQACLALNRNNEAVSLLSALSASDCKAWEEWTGALVSAQPESSAAWYLAGDARLRMGQTGPAVDAYTKALALAPNLELALVGRGIAHASAGEWETAEADVDQACKAKLPLAEAFVARGNLELRHCAAEGASKSFEKALELSPDYALALNGRGCAKYGMADWAGSIADFGRGAREQPIVLFSGNARAVAIAYENLAAPGEGKSPRFRPSDFINWPELCKRTVQTEDVMRTLVGRTLEGELSVPMLDKINGALGNAGFFVSVSGRWDMNTASTELRKSIEATADLRARHSAKLSDAEKAQVELLNRLILEHFYPDLVARRDQRDPGTQLTVTGFQDMRAFKDTLAPQQIASGQWRVDHLWRPMADAVSSSGNPIGDFLGKQWTQHLDLSTKMNDASLGARGMKLDDLRPGGVTTELRRGFINEGAWPVASCYGLLPGMVVRPGQSEDTQQKEMGR